MNKSVLGRVALAALVGLPTTVLAEGPEKVGGAQGVERDDANVRRKGMARWYETPVSPDFKRFLNQAAAKERVIATDAPVESPKP